VRTKLLPQLSAVYRDAGRRETERSLATDLLADYAGDNSQLLADLLMDADDKQFAVIYPKFKEQGEKALPLLIGKIDMKLPADMPASDPDREELAKRQANAAVTLLRRNQPEKVWPLLKHSSDPRGRSYLIHRLSPMGADAEKLIKRLEEEPDLTVRRALLLSLGEFNEMALPPASRTSLLPKLQTIYRNDTDPGLHAAAEWLLRTWKQEEWLNQVNDEWAKDKVKAEAWWVAGKTKDARPVRHDPPPATPNWYVNGQGQTMVVIPGPVEFVMGSPPTEAGREARENQHKRRIGRAFALAAKSVTLAEYQRFDAGYGGEVKQWAPSGVCPVLGISWFQAAGYCNWLSKQEGLPESEWCYVPVRDPGRTDPEYKVGMRLAANYLTRSGYRLPTETEIEFATRAGSVTSRFYGEAEELLPKYAWYNKNGQDRSWPVGRKKPNDFGLFDVHGNVFTWCQERFQPYRKANETTEDKEDILDISLENRGLRGGSFAVQQSIVRSAFRQGVVPTYRSDGDVGLRPARTLPLDPLTALPASPNGP
jgi:formylglycine-generating enzyme required for sulfatase activity